MLWPMGGEGSGARSVPSRWRLGAACAVATAAVATALVLTVRPFSPSRAGHRHAERGERVPVENATARVVAGNEAAPPGKASWVVAENALAGTTEWRLTAGARGAVEGFADHASARRGDAVTLYVNTAAATFHVEAYRMGYYGGRGGRLVWRSAEVQGQRQQAPAPDPGSHMVEARWHPSLSVQPDESWPPGDYLLKLVTAAGQQYVPLTLRDDASHSAYVVQNSVTTWQAYNRWGGYDLYEGEDGTFAHRARTVSFDRPYRIGDGSGDFLGSEYPLVSLVESLGLDVTYWTDVDLHERPQLLLQHRALLSLGHDEYWSTAMRAGAESARDAGVNLAFFGANAVFRHIRLGSSPLGTGRRVIDYKSAREDPVRFTDRSEVTVDWREPPVSRPESALIGNYYECNPVHADMVVADAGAWVFAGTDLAAGDHLEGVVGSEYDRYDRTAPGPANVQVLTHSPLRCAGKSSFSDSTYYTAASGAGVFASGTSSWIPRLDAACGPPCPGKALVRITENVLAAFGPGPSGLAHPSVASAPGAEPQPERVGPVPAPVPPPVPAGSVRPRRMPPRPAPRVVPVSPPARSRATPTSWRARSPHSAGSRR
jgi:hypothetical protein